MVEDELFTKMMTKEELFERIKKRCEELSQNEEFNKKLDKETRELKKDEIRQYVRGSLKRSVKEWKR